MNYNRVKADVDQLIIEMQQELKSEGWTMADWQKLADDFIREFDAVSLRRRD